MFSYRGFVGHIDGLSVQVYIFSVRSKPDIYTVYCIFRILSARNSLNRSLNIYAILYTVHINQASAQRDLTGDGATQPVLVCGCVCGSQTAGLWRISVAVFITARASISSVTESATMKAMSTARFLALLTIMLVTFQCSYCNTSQGRFGLVGI